MGCALGIVWSLKTQTPRFWAYLFFFLQLIFNGLWSFFFFYLHDPLLAFIDIIALWLAIVLTLLAFWQHSRLAACLLIPYLLWVSFAILINLWITIYN
jgi:tryptophan-rich sensory protein